MRTETNLVLNKKEKKDDENKLDFTSPEERERKKKGKDRFENYDEFEDRAIGPQDVKLIVDEDAENDFFP
jgi:hypothetical protein